MPIRITPNPKSAIGFAATVLLVSVTVLGSAAAICASPLDKVSGLLGAADAALIVSPRGEPIFEKNQDKKLIPASVLKIFTALAAFHHLGPDYHFRTEFYLSPERHLKIKGYGDPLLISESLPGIAAELSMRIREYNDLELDDSFFLKPIRIPGISPTYQPYDAPNSALSVNFNTVNFKRSGNSYISAEEQTPLLPFVMEKIESSSLTDSRIILSSSNDECTLYAGHLMKHFLAEAGVKSEGKIKIGRVQEPRDRLLLTVRSPFSLRQIVEKLLEFSNNFIANQLLLTVGAEVYTPPGTLEKGIRASLAFAEEDLGIRDLELAEGSGISRRNRISAGSLSVVLKAFGPYCDLLRQRDSESYKTGNLSGVQTRAGYMMDDAGGRYRFVVLVNTPGKSIKPIMRQIRRYFRSLEK